jgi:hypothetical protein
MHKKRGGALNGLGSRRHHTVALMATPHLGVEPYVREDQNDVKMGSSFRKN